MAAFSKRLISQILGKKPPSKLLINTNESFRQHSRRTLTLLGTFGSLIIGWNTYKYRHDAKFPVVFAKAEKPEACKVAVLGRREKRFLDFASVEFNGKIYMTPQDFLESVTEETPRPRRARTKLESPDVLSWLQKTPARSRGSTHFFRSLHDKGLLSYTEYLFLLCVLTKPHSGFGIAFNMFDTDGNKKVDKTEFLVLESMFLLMDNGKLDPHIAQPNTWSSGNGSVMLPDVSANVRFATLGPLVQCPSQ